MPIPKDGADAVSLDVDLMYLIGLAGVEAIVYLGTSPDVLEEVMRQSRSENILPLIQLEAFANKTKYYWRVDTQRADGSVVPGPVWSFTLSNDAGSDV